MTPTGIDVEWRLNDRPFLPRIDYVSRRGGVLTLSGNFGLRSKRVMRLERRSDGFGADLQSNRRSYCWSPSAGVERATSSRSRSGGRSCRGS